MGNCKSKSVFGRTQTEKLRLKKNSQKIPTKISFISDSHNEYEKLEKNNISFEETFISGKWTGNIESVDDGGWTPLPDFDLQFKETNNDDGLWVVSGKGCDKRGNYKVHGVGSVRNRRIAITKRWEDDNPWEIRLTLCKSKSKELETQNIKYIWKGRWYYLPKTRREILASQYIMWPVSP